MRGRITRGSMGVLSKIIMLVVVAHSEIMRY
jgi:hypothetical protein